MLKRDLLMLNYLFYLDDVKLCARSHAELESLITTIENFSTNICMYFEFDKCRSMSVI